MFEKVKLFLTYFWSFLKYDSLHILSSESPEVIKISDKSHSSFSSESSFWDVLVDKAYLFSAKLKPFRVVILIFVQNDFLELI